MLDYPVCLPPCLHHVEEDSQSRSPRRPLKQTYAQAGMWHPPRSMTSSESYCTRPQCSAAVTVDLQHETDWRKIVEIDSMERPGLRFLRPLCEMRCMFTGNGAHSVWLPQMQATWRRWFRANRLWGIRYQYCIQKAETWGMEPVLA